MSTPVEQNVPEEFRGEIDIPVPDQVDAAALAKAEAARKKEKANEAKVAAQLKATNTKIKSLQGQLKIKGLSKSRKAKLTAELKTYQARAKSQASQQKKSQAKQTTYQQDIYEAKGQYDKLLWGEQRDAYMALTSLFKSYGLEGLAKKIFDYVKLGFGADTIAIHLQDTKEYKARFAANEARAKAGLPVLSPADYLATEQAYRQILSAAGLPKGFYDNPADFTRWIADDVSPTEIKSRVDMAVAATSQANPEYKRALWQMYGIGEADLAAYFLDRKKAEPILKKQAAAGAIGAAAIRRGFAANVLDLEGYATLGITPEEAEEAYARISEGFEAMLGIAGRYGSTWSQREAEQEIFTPGAAASVGGESAAEKGKRLKSQERALFAGGRGATVQGLNAGYSQT
jgi:hypothetical protein